MKKIVVFCVFSSIIMISCNINKKSLLGNYYFKGENVIDTLIIKKDIYVHRIYDKNSRLMYQGENQWTLENDRITLLKFYNNEDNKSEEFLSNKDAQKFLMISSFPIYENGNEVTIEVNADENILYKKK